MDNKNDKDTIKRCILFALIAIAIYTVYFKFSSPSNTETDVPTASEAVVSEPVVSDDPAENNTSAAESGDPAQSEEEPIKILGMTIPDILLSAFFLFLIYLVYAEDKSGKKRKVLTRLFGSSVADFFAKFEIKQDPKKQK